MKPETLTKKHLAVESGTPGVCNWCGGPVEAPCHYGVPSVPPLPPDIGCWLPGCRCARCVEIARREAAGEPLS